jgi:hypothetical protein
MIREGCSRSEGRRGCKPQEWLSRKSSPWPSRRGPTHAAGHVGVDGSSDRPFHAACQDRRSGLDPLTNRNLGLDLGVIILVDKSNCRWAEASLFFSVDLEFLHLNPEG